MLTARWVIVACQPRVCGNHASLSQIDSFHDGCKPTVSKYDEEFALHPSKVSEVNTASTSIGSFGDVDEAEVGFRGVFSPEILVKRRFFRRSRHRRVNLKMTPCNDAG
jgi:hypothetical protein